MQRLPPSFMLLQQEGYLLSRCLSIGLTELRNARVQNQGAFYTALFNLSVGTERLLKSIIIIDHMINNNLDVPSKKEIKQYGHNITELYDACEKISGSRNTPIIERNQLDLVDNEILNLLSDFARITRYHNLDALSSSQVREDPLSQWNKILLAILDKDVSKSQKEKILSQARMIASSIDDVTFTFMYGLDQSPITTEQALLSPRLHEQATRYIILRLVKILIRLRDLIEELSSMSYISGSSQPPFPQMQEFLEWLWDDRQFVLRKKKWP